MCVYMYAYVSIERNKYFCKQTKAKTGNPKVSLIFLRVTWDLHMLH